MASSKQTTPPILRERERKRESTFLFFSLLFFLRKYCVAMTTLPTCCFPSHSSEIGQQPSSCCLPRTRLERGNEREFWGWSHGQLGGGVRTCAVPDNCTQCWMGVQPQATKSAALIRADPLSKGGLNGQMGATPEKVICSNGEANCGEPPPLGPLTYCCQVKAPAACHLHSSTSKHNGVSQVSQIGNGLKKNAKKMVQKPTNVSLVVSSLRILQ